MNVGMTITTILTAVVKSRAERLIVIRRIQKEIHTMAKEGCHIRVIRSNLPEDMGVEGIVLLESKNQFVLVTTKNKVRKVTKANHVFQVIGVESMFILLSNKIEPFVLYGSYLCGNSDFEFRRQPHKQLFSLNTTYYSCLFSFT